MTDSSHHQQVEDRFRELLTDAGLPHPDDVAHLERALVFLWYDSKAFVLLDLEEMPDTADPFDGLDLDALAADIHDEPLGARLPFTGIG